jgi:two-component system response regulator
MSTVPISEAPPCKRVLVVEDDLSTAELISRTLQHSGYAVEIAGGVEAGLKALRDNSSTCYDALLLDYRLPDGEPWQVADAALARIPEVPVIFVTGMNDETVAIEALRRGFADYVKKADGFWNELPAILERVARLSRIKGRLDETSALMRAIVEHSTDLVAVYSGEGKLVYVSPVCHTLLGRNSEELFGRSWMEIVVPEDRSHLLEMFARLEENAHQESVLRCRHKDGSFSWVEARAERLQPITAAQPMIVLTLHDVTAQRAHEEKMASSLREKEVLLREIHHRVKNNLQVIQSLLRMRARLLPEGEARAAMESTVQRIHAMGLAHEHLYQREDLARLSLSGYLRELFNRAVASSAAQADQILLRLDAEDLLLSLELAIPFGLLANELIANCFKHGFPEGRRGTIALSVHRVDGVVRLMVSDNGIGLPESFNPDTCPSMGLKLAASLAHQLGGTLRFTNDNGCCVETDLTRL